MAMATIRLTKEFTFEMAHALEGYDGPCKNIHGHSYKLEVTVIGKPCTDSSASDYGMVLDFGKLKKIVNEVVIHRFDHVLLIPKQSALYQKIDELPLGKTLAVDFQPTCENMLNHIAPLITERLPEHVRLFRLKLHETATSYAEWYASDNS